MPWPIPATVTPRRAITATPARSGSVPWKLYEEIESPQGRSEVLINLGITYHLEGDDLQALEHYQRALEISETIGDRLENARGLRRVGEAYARLNQMDQGLETLKQALELAQQVQIHPGKMDCHLPWPMPTV